ncbi:Uncharacterised protein [Pantoea agglomerans]|nr:Uncharacterised protein [Pantoea agglomerans]
MHASLFIKIYLINSITYLYFLLLNIAAFATGKVTVCCIGNNPVRLISRFCLTHAVWSWLSC